MDGEPGFSWFDRMILPTSRSVLRCPVNPKMSWAGTSSFELGHHRHSGDQSRTKREIPASGMVIANLSQKPDGNVTGGSVRNLESSENTGTTPPQLHRVAIGMIFRVLHIRELADEVGPARIRDRTAVRLSQPHYSE